jgi:hypothetical protein
MSFVLSETWFLRKVDDTYSEGSQLETYKNEKAFTAYLDNHSKLRLIPKFT